MPAAVHSQAVADSHPAFLAAVVASVVLSGRARAVAHSLAAIHNRPVSLAVVAALVVLIGRAGAAHSLAAPATERQAVAPVLEAELPNCCRSRRRR